MAKQKFIKLGEKASSFSCPTTGISLNKESLIELTPVIAASKAVKRALKGGHLEYADSEEIKAFQESGKHDDGEMSREFLETKNKAGLLELALVKVADDEDYTEANIKQMNKSELIDYLLDEGEDEDEDN